MDAKWRSTAWDIFSKYPGSLVHSLLSGMSFGMITHNTNDLALASGRIWVNPGIANLARMNIRKFVRGLFANHPFLIFVFVWQMVLTTGLLAMASVGVMLTLRDSTTRTPSIGLLAIAAYYFCTMAMQGIAPDARIRAPLIPILCIFAAIGATKLIEFSAHSRGRVMRTDAACSRGDI
jgi:hypothetical protein